MIRKTFVLTVGWLVLAVFSQAAMAQAPAFLISCQGTESNGGGANRYEYMIQNITAAPINVVVLEIASNDPNFANYTNWTMPAGFGVKLTNNTAYWMAETKTPHGAISPGPAFIPPVYVEWSGGAVLNPGQTLGPFGFDHPWRSADAEWMTCGPLGNPMTVGNWQLPVAGPIGTYTAGPVHAPVPEPASLALLGLAAMMVYRRR